jgi:hypothetical protein
MLSLGLTMTVPREARPRAYSDIAGKLIAGTLPDGFRETFDFDSSQNLRTRGNGRRWYHGVEAEQAGSKLLLALSYARSLSFATLERETGQVYARADRGRRVGRNGGYRRWATIWVGRCHMLYR